MRDILRSIWVVSWRVGVGVMCSWLLVECYACAKRDVETSRARRQACESSSVCPTGQAPMWVTGKHVKDHCACVIPVPGELR